MLKLSAETKFNIQHFEIFFLFFPENKNMFFCFLFFFLFFFFLGGGGGWGVGWGGGGQYQLVIACGISPESGKG